MIFTTQPLNRLKCTDPCAEACNDMSESYLCKYWTWTPVKKECILHHGKAQAVHDLAISGPVDCTTEWVNCC